MAPTSEITSLDIGVLQSQYDAGSLSPLDVVRHVYAAISAYHDKAVWIYLVPEDEALARARELADRYATGTRPPLFGVPFSVKDSVDIAGLPTTLACPSFAYTATATATAIARILDAGGILIGKTNLDQFATGLAGVRSPYGVPRCVFDADYISGGSSSGSAVSVAASLVSFTVCTDTGGSTRVPAAFNGVVGFKPTLGSISTRGLFPACKNIDCVCVISRRMPDAETVWSVMAAYDEEDVYSRVVPGVGPPPSAVLQPSTVVPALPPWPSAVRLGVPDEEALAGLSPSYAALFRQTMAALESAALGCVHASFDYTPFAEANQMLYDSSIVSQRLLAFEPYLQEHGVGALDPAIRTTFEEAAARAFSATQAYRDIFALAALKRKAYKQFSNIDALIVPSTVDQFTVAELQEQPMARNKVMGRFTNFVNLLDLCAVSVPVGWWKSVNGRDLPFAVTVVGQAGQDRQVMALGKRLMEMPRLRLE